MTKPLVLFARWFEISVDFNNSCRFSEMGPLFYIVQFVHCFRVRSVIVLDGIIMLKIRIDFFTIYGVICYRAIGIVSFIYLLIYFFVFFSNILTFGHIIFDLWNCIFIHLLFFFVFFLIF